MVGSDVDELILIGAGSIRQGRVYGLRNLHVVVAIDTQYILNQVSLALHIHTIGRNGDGQHTVLLLEDLHLQRIEDRTYVLTLEKTVVRSVSISNKKLVSFYDERGNLLEEQLVEYGLGEKSAFTMFLINNPQVENEKGVKENVPTPNIVYFSDVVTDEETGEEYRYAFAPLFNIVVKMPTYNCRFLEYDLNTWISNNIFMQNIGKFASVSVKSEGVDISFKLEGEGTALVVTDNNGHKPEVKNFRLFYQVLLGMLKEGPVSLTEEQVKALVADESNVTATLTLKTHKGEKLEYKFYSFGIKSYYTINGEGEFMLPTSQVEKMVNDAVRVTRDEVVYPDNAV